MNLKELTPKAIIIDNIKDRFKESGIKKALINFNVIDDSYRIMLLKEDDTPLEIKIEKSEITMIKLVFINKIRKAYDKKTEDKMKSVILEIEVFENLFNIFIEDIKGNVTKFDY